MKKYIYLEVCSRELSGPIFFDTFEDARKKMVEDFIRIAGEDGRFDDDDNHGYDDDGEVINISDISVDSLMSLNDYAEFTECGIGKDEAWINDTYTHDDWDAYIVEVTI